MVSVPLRYSHSPGSTHPNHQTVAGTNDGWASTSCWASSEARTREPAGWRVLCEQG